MVAAFRPLVLLFGVFGLVATCAGLCAQQPARTPATSKGSNSAVSANEPIANDPALGEKIGLVLPTDDEQRWLDIPWRTNIVVRE